MPDLRLLCLQTLKPSLSVPLVNATVCLSPSLGPCCMEISVPNSSIFSLTSSPTKYGLRTPLCSLPGQGDYY